MNRSGQSPSRQDKIQFARDQRAYANEFAFNVWQMVRNRKCRGRKFRREHPVGPYFADFCCVELKLIVEVDGESHFTVQGQENDAIRDDYLRKLGYEIIRIPGYLVLSEPGLVRLLIEDAIMHLE